MNLTIINNLDKLVGIYENLPSKKFQLRALKNGLAKIKKYNKLITSGKQARSEIESIGSGLESRIDEILNTSTLKEFELYPEFNSKNSTYNTNNELLDITGVGQVRANQWNKLGIYTLKDLKNAVLLGTIDTTHHINIGIKYYDDLKLKISRDEIDKIYEYLKNIIKLIDKDLILEICGSYRRGSLESGDIDVLITNPKILQNIESKKYLTTIINKLTETGFIIDSLTDLGQKKYMGICKISKYARRIDIRVFNFENAMAALVYFTGNKDFNVHIRNKALSMGYSLNEYGMIKVDDPDKNIIHFAREEDLFDFLKIEYVKPTNRNY